MEQQEINRLLAKYYEGLTSVEEETLLREMGLTERLNVSDGILQQFFREERKKQTDVAYRVQLLNKFREPISIFKHRLLYPVVAALLILGLVVTSVVRSNYQNTLQSTTDPQLAYEQTKETLGLIAHYLNKGTAELEQINHFDNSMNYLKYLHTIEVKDHKNEHDNKDE